MKTWKSSFSYSLLELLKRPVHILLEARRSTIVDVVLEPRRRTAPSLVLQRRGYSSASSNLAVEPHCTTLRFAAEIDLEKGLPWRSSFSVEPHLGWCSLFSLRSKTELPLFVLFRVLFPFSFPLCSLKFQGLFLQLLNFPHFLSPCRFNTTKFSRKWFGVRRNLSTR